MMDAELQALIGSIGKALILREYMSLSCLVMEQTLLSDVLCEALGSVVKAELLVIYLPEQRSVLQLE